MPRPGQDPCDNAWLCSPCLDPELVKCRFRKNLHFRQFLIFCFDLIPPPPQSAPGASQDAFKRMIIISLPALWRALISEIQVSLKNTKSRVFLRVYQKEICLQYGISATSYYRLVDEYRLFGPWAIIPANLPGKEAMSSATELNIILEKLRYPGCSAQQIVRSLKLRCSKYAVYRVFSRWGLTDKSRTPIALDRYFDSEPSKADKPFTGIASAYHLYPEQFLLESRRI